MNPHIKIVGTGQRTKLYCAYCGEPFHCHNPAWRTNRLGQWRHRCKMEMKGNGGNAKRES